MNPWDLLLNLLGWGLVVVIGLLILSLIAALVVAFVAAVRPKKKSPLKLVK